MSEKTSERCPTCDRAECPDLPFQGMDCDEFDEVAGIPGTEQYAAYLEESAAFTTAVREMLADLAATGRPAPSDLAAELRDFAERLGPNCEANYMGGYSQARDIEIFQHGMGTVCSVVRAFADRKARSAPSEAPRPMTVADCLRDGRPFQYVTPYGTLIRLERSSSGRWLATSPDVPGKYEAELIPIPVLDLPATLVPASEAP